MPGRAAPELLGSLSRWPRRALGTFAAGLGGEAALALRVQRERCLLTAVRMKGLVYCPEQRGLKLIMLQ